MNTEITSIESEGKHEQYCQDTILNNNYEKYLFEQADFLLDEVKVDEIYIDQFASGCSLYPLIANQPQGLKNHAGIR